MPESFLIAGPISYDTIESHRNKKRVDEKEIRKGILFDLSVAFTECDEGSFKCDSSVRSHCLPDTWLCDGYTDCPGGEDEQQQICGL